MQASVKRPKRIVIIMSTAGGGHKSAANALAEALVNEYEENVIVEIIDILKQYAPQPFDKGPEFYQFMVKAPLAWKNFYEIGNSPRRSKIITSSLAIYARRTTQKLVDNHPADAIISTYHFANAPILNILKRNHMTIPFITVVTDLVTAPPAWFDKRTTLCITPTAEAAEVARDNGLPASAIEVIGLPVSNDFTPPTRPKSQLKAALGWPADKPVIIAMAGGEGIGSLEQIAENLTTLDATIVVITAKNTTLYNKLLNSNTAENVKIYGFVDTMPQFMQAADLLVTKAGPGTIVEALNSHLPLLLYAKLSGQEDGNVDFVTQHGAGVWQPKLGEIAGTVQLLLDTPGALGSMAAAAGTLAQPGAGAKIARAIGRLLPD